MTKWLLPVLIVVFFWAGLFPPLETLSLRLPWTLWALHGAIFVCGVVYGRRMLVSVAKLHD